MLTRSGLGLGVAAIVLGVCGWWWGYDELIALAAGASIAIGFAIWSSRTPVRVTIDRTLSSPRVARGDPIRAVYRIVNPTRRRSAPMLLVDRFGPADVPDAEVRIDIPTIGALDRCEEVGLLPTRRRGVFDVGPWTVERVDPLGLAVGQRAGNRIGKVIVHPRIHPLGGPYGAMHTVEDEAVVRKAASDPLSGFVSLREYVDGDDPRLIHWPTSARMGTLMLREHVELRRPEFTVVLDCAEQVATADDFEEMVDVAASIAVHALRSGVDVSLRTTSRDHPGAMRPIDRETRVLDLLTPVGRVDDDHQMSLTEIFHAGVDHTSIVFVTGPDGPSSVFHHTDRLTTVRVGEGAVPGRGVMLAVDDAATFAERWRP